MTKIARVEIFMVDLHPKVQRTDAIQAFDSQQTPFVQITDAEGVTGIGYSYTIGQGGSAVMALLRDDLIGQLIGQEAEDIDRIWRELMFCIHALTVGPVSSLALAAIDIALWDLRCKRAGLPLYQMLGGAKKSVPMYTTEGGWLHIETKDLVADALEAKNKGFTGSKVKIGRPTMAQDRARLTAVRDAVGLDYEIMVDANQSLTVSQAKQRARMLEDLDIAWFEEPLPADDMLGHASLADGTSVPIAVGESMYSLSQFKDYLVLGAASIVQVDVARIGGITPWMKVAHLAEAFNASVCPHFLMELHVSLVCAIPNAPWLEYIPQLDSLTKVGMKMKNGRAYASNAPGIGIDWDIDAISANIIKQYSAQVSS